MGTLVASETLAGNGGTGADTIDASALGEAIIINAGAGANILTGSNQADTITGVGIVDTIKAGALVDMLTGAAGNDVFIFLRSLMATTDRDIILDGENIDHYVINTSTGDALNGIGVGLVDGNGNASAAIGDTASAKSSVATAINVAAAGAIAVSAAGAGFAGGFNGVMAAQNVGFDLTESGDGALANDNKMIAVVEDTTANQIEVGFVEMDGAGKIDGVGVFFETAIIGGLSTSDVASSINCTGLA